MGKLFDIPQPNFKKEFGKTSGGPSKRKTRHKTGIARGHFLPIEGSDQLNDPQQPNEGESEGGCGEDNVQNDESNKVDGRCGSSDTERSGINKPGADHAQPPNGKNERTPEPSERTSPEAEETYDSRTHGGSVSRTRPVVSRMAKRKLPDQAPGVKRAKRA
ncbi:hypothetical protein FRC11_009007 [Ceratobasidium sp. 423]|nr:hypothetical protein FRC11_009007 [Ceratobasidium sp. 423]